MEEIALAEAILTGVSKLCGEAQEEWKQVRDKEKVVDKRKNNILDHLIVSKNQRKIK